MLANPLKRIRNGPSVLAVVRQRLQPLFTLRSGNGYLLPVAAFSGIQGAVEPESGLYFPPSWSHPLAHPLPQDAPVVAERPLQHPYRWLEVIFGLLVWALVTAPFWAPALSPKVFLYSIIAFDVWWLLRSLSTVLFGVIGFFKVKAAMRTDWFARYLHAEASHKTYCRWQDVHHLVIIPNLSEKIEKLRKTLTHIALQDEAKERISVVLAMEAREGGAEAKAALLLTEFQDRFAHIFYTLHPADLPGETKGKSSNECWAAKRAKDRLVDQMGYNLDHIVITIADADSVFHPQYFSCLTYKFCTDPRRHRRFWQSPIMQYNNVWQVPWLVRMVSVLPGISYLADLVKPHQVVFPYSTYSLSLRMAHEVGYWDANVVPEDWHMFLKSFFHLNGEVDVVPIFLPTHCDAVHASSYWKTLVNCYRQAKRWAWGATDVIYAAAQFLEHRDIPFWRRLRRLWKVTEHHLLWAPYWFLITLGAVIPSLTYGVQGSRNPLAELLAIPGMVLSLCLVPLVGLLLVDVLMRPPRPAHVRWWMALLGYLPWLFIMPLTSLFFAALPALDAHTRLMLGQLLDYHVTEKA